MNDVAHANAQLAAIVQASDDAIISTDLEGFVLTWNRGAEVLYGYLADEIVGQNISVVYLDGEHTSLKELLTRNRDGHFTGPIQGLRRRRDGSIISVEVRLSPMFDLDGAPMGACAIARDVTEREAKEAELEENRSFLERTQEVGHIGSWRAELGGDSILEMSTETRRILGIDETQIVRNIDFYKLIHPDDQELVFETLIKTRSEKVRSEVEARLLRPDQTQRWVLIVADALSDASGETVTLTGVVHDITQRKAIEASLANDALYDRLTGLPNRSLLLDRTQRAITRMNERGSSLAVLFVDIDRFNDLNERRGHQSGDALLVAIADRLRQSIAPTDTVSRVSADEFVVTYEGMNDSADAALRAGRILEQLRLPLQLPDGDCLVTASIGVAISTSGVSAESLVRDAELAMFRAKQSGRDRYELYDHDLRHQANQRFAFEAGLRRALDGEEFFLEYQPIASLEQNRFVGAEALIRWQHPERGVIAPGHFIPIAEEIGLIAPIGAWVIESACQQLKSWQRPSPDRAPWSVAINVSAAQLRDPDFARFIERAIDRAGVEGTSILLELTESNLVEGAVTEEVLRAIRSLGIRLCIDDFGTRYSTISYLKRLPIDELKIDSSFIEAIGEDESARKVVAAIVALGQALDLRVTAEGVETETQLDILRDLGCDAAQGFCLSKPVPAEESLATLLGPLPPAKARRG